jgi:uncharacterized protein DUF1206
LSDVFERGRPQRVERAANELAESKPFEWLARSGFAARASIYAIIGILALKLALGIGGKTTNQKGALETVIHQPFGQILLILLAVGLAGYALWRLMRAALGHGPEDTDSGFDRIAAAGSGVVSALICAIAVELLFSSGSGSSGNARKTTGGVLGWPGGPWLVGIAGAVVVGVGLYQAYSGLTREFLKDSKTEQMSRGVRKAVTWIGTYGHLARAVIFVLVGVFLIKAAVDFNPKAAVGLDGALAKLVHSSYGPSLLGIVSAGLIAFAAYSVSDVRYRRI